MSKSIFFQQKTSSSVQLLIRVRLCNLMDCRTPGSLSTTNFQSLHKLMSIQSVMPSSSLILCCPLLLLLSSFLASGSFQRSQFFESGGQSNGISASASVQFSSVVQSCLTLCNPTDFSMPGLPVHYQLPKFTQTHVHWVNDAIQPSHPLSFPSSPAFNLSQLQGIFQCVNSSHQAAKVLEFQLQQQSLQWTFRTVHL